MQHIDDIAAGKTFPGVDLTLWVQLIVGAVVAIALIALCAWGISAL